MTAKRGRRRTGTVGRLTNIRRDRGAWTVSVIRRAETFADYFPDAVWGGREGALVAAQRFRDGLLLHIGPDTRVRRTVPRSASSSTGVVGVTLEEHEVDGKVYERAVAQWRDADKKTRRRRFLVERYGMQRALALARAARKAGVAKAHAERLARQRREAARRLQEAPPLPAQVKDPLSRKGISMARRRPRREV